MVNLPILNTFRKMNPRGSFPIERVICEKLPGGAKKRTGSALTSVTDQNYGFPHKSKNCGHLEKSLV